MCKLKLLNALRFIKKNWHVRVKSVGGSSQIEVTDPSYLWVNIDDLLDDVIELAFHDFNFLSISQFVDKNQWDIGEKEVFIRNVSNKFSLPIVLSRNYGTNEEARIGDNSFVLNIIGRPEKRWLKKVVRFGMINNPNILYGLQSIPENWFPQITEWNIHFRNWFELKSSPIEIEKIATQVDMMGWTEDGHLNLVLKDAKKRDELLKAIAKLADEKSLTLFIDHKKEEYFNKS
jgi:hypothetical protein